jgi:hypothetical protein
MVIEKRRQAFSDYNRSTPSILTGVALPKHYLLWMEKKDMDCLVKQGADQSLS